VQISVSDDGPGIPDEAKKHLFDFPSKNRPAGRRERIFAAGGD
jgi:signal transduction histidine kinase